jgi:hypothetical protein
MLISNALQIVFSAISIPAMTPIACGYIVYFPLAAILNDAITYGVRNLPI